MKEYKADAIKNVVLLGHLGSGKTSLAESLAFISGAIDKKGSVEKRIQFQISLQRSKQNLVLYHLV